MCIATDSGDQADQGDETTGHPAGDDFMISSMHTMMPDDIEASMRTTFEMDKRPNFFSGLLKNTLLLITVSIIFVIQCNGWWILFLQKQLKELKYCSQMIQIQN